MKDIVLLDLFSGIGGFTKGFTEAGFNIKTHYFSEIDKHAIAIYKYQFKDSIYAGDVTTLGGRSITRPNIITFGSPCQDFSVAGKRAGLEGQRSSLIGEAIRLIAECRPDFFIWENVKGVFSSNNGADFWAVIQAFANIGGYRLEWQLLNTAWFLPQNRERIYLVGHLAKLGRDFKGIFPIRYGNRIFEQGEGTQGRGGGELCSTITSNLKRGVHAAGETYIQLVEPTHKHGEERAYDDIAPTIQSRYGTGGERKRDEDGKAVLTSMHERRIRRLTEIECERLQGFPDDWTEYGDYDGIIKKVAKTQRYKALGNAVTVAVVKEVALRIKELFT